MARWASACAAALAMSRAPVLRTISTTASSLIGGALLDGVAHNGGLLGAAALHGCDQGQGAFAFAQVVAQVLAHFLGVAGVVQHIVDDLESRSQGLAIGGAGLFHFGVAPASTAASCALASKSWAVLERITCR